MQTDFLNKVGQEVELAKLSGTVTFNIISKILFGTDFEADDLMIDFQNLDGSVTSLNYYEAMLEYVHMAEKAYLSGYVVLFGSKGISWNMGKSIQTVR